MKRILLQYFGHNAKSKTMVCALMIACLLMLVPGALAEVDTSAAPVLTLTLPSSPVVAGSKTMFVLTASLPGFMDLTILDGDGSEVFSVKNYELHSNVNSMTFSTKGKDGLLLPIGTYTVEAQMTSQFGVKSNEVTASLTIIDAPVQPTATVSPTMTAQPTVTVLPPESDTQEPYEDEEGDESYDESEPSDDEQQSSGPLSAPPHTPVAADDVSYTSGDVITGEEGLQIGVGVSDYAQQEDAGYWGLTASASDAEIWAALQHAMTRVNVPEKEFAYIYDSTGEERRRIATISGLSQGLNVISRSDGWALVEAYRNEDGAFVRGYIRSNTLTTVTPNPSYGIVIDKAAQMLYIYRNGERVGSCQVCTGLATGDHLNRETPAGEFITMTRRGTVEYINEYHKCMYTIRINGNYHLCEIPFSTDNKSNFSLMGDKLGQKASRGNICIAHEASADGGINASWIWDMTDANRRVKVLIFDDKDRSQVPVGE